MLVQLIIGDTLAIGLAVRIFCKKIAGLFKKHDSETGEFDVDPGAVIGNHRLVKVSKEKNLLPLVMDLANPSPALGWCHQERQSLIGRGPVDMAMALALVHHLAIGNNVPLGSIANFFADICQYLIVEFIPKSDSQVKRLLSSRVDIFPDYNLDGFEKAFKQHFKIHGQQQVESSERILYLMQAIEK